MKQLFIEYIRVMLGGAILLFIIGLLHKYEVIDLNEKLALSASPKSCVVTVQRGQMTPGTQCLWNRVMTGITGNYILCSDLTVECSE